MILSGVLLFQNTTNAGAVFPDENKNVLSNKRHLRQMVDYLDMRQSLFPRADLVLAFDDVASVPTQHPPRFLGGHKIQV